MAIDTHVRILPVASWGSIIGGVVAVFAVSVLLSLLGSAIGFGMIDAQADNPVDGVGTTFGIWSAVALIISLAAGGFVAGRLAGEAGVTHGFLVWCTALLVASILSLAAIGGAVRLTGSAVGSVFSVAGKAGAAAGEGVGNVAGWITEEFDLDLNMDIDAQEVRRDVLRALRDSDIETLQPDYLRGQLREAGDDVAASLRQLRYSDTTLEQVTSDLVQKLRARAEQIGQDIDRNEVVNAITSNTDMTRQEAEDLVDDLIAGYEDTVEEVNQRLDQLGNRIEAAQAELEQLEQQARDAADKAADALARSALWAFLGLLLGALVAGGAGLLGARTRSDDVIYTDPFRR